MANLLNARWNRGMKCLRSRFDSLIRGLKRRCLLAGNWLGRRDSEEMCHPSARERLQTAPKPHTCVRKWRTMGGIDVLVRIIDGENPVGYAKTLKILRGIKP